MPCTVVNLVVAVAAGAVVGLAAPAAGIAVFAGSVAVIYFRGYLVPGTPTLTKRYLPESVLRLFDKQQDAAAAVVDGEAFDVEDVLLDADVVTECQNGHDLCLTPWFERAWYERIESVRDADDDGVEDLFDSLDVDPDRVSVRDHGDAYVALVDDVRVGQWESRAAYVADLAAMAVLSEEYHVWSALGFDQRTQLLGALRLWLDRCPSCDGAVTLGEETVESCCRSIDVVAATCEGCGSRVFEAEFSPDQLAA
ncbi:MAG: hypothetical protein ABEJ90_04700 [Halobacterium sp.]